MVIRGLAVGLLAAAAWGCGDAESEGSGGAGGGEFAVPVEVATAKVDTVIDGIQATGQIEAVQSIILRPDIDGRITNILFREGRYVRSGTPLFKVDDAELVAQVARAEAERDLSRQALERTRTLIGQDAASQADLERAPGAPELFRSLDGTFLHPVEHELDSFAGVSGVAAPLVGFP